MKALIRNEGETVTEDMGHNFIDWRTGMPLTGKKWCGGPYTLIDNYVPPADEEDVIQHKQTKVEEKIAEDDDCVIIDGKKYSKTELRSLLE